MSFLRRKARERTKEMLRNLDETAFDALIAELYARTGADVNIIDEVQTGAYDFVLYSDYFSDGDEIERVAVECQQLQQNFSYHYISQKLSKDLIDEFDKYCVCTTAENKLQAFIRDRLRRNGFDDSWFRFQNYSTVKKLLERRHNDYLTYLYFELNPSEFDGYWRNHEYLRKRFEYLGVTVTAPTLSRIAESENPLHDINMIEKFVLIESLWGDPVTEHIDPTFNTKDLLQVGVQAGRPFESDLNPNIFTDPR